ncbi:MULTISPECIES: 4-(cytidine 5'-diphospho)-2-C-methyl-D-erythritol kinase [Pseudomonas]|uniref:4-diphosphocytidyl-2-C-methyl-D-erythritol kinase n=1 Tax=Pseudomonas guariconensis TaxID=1288410 RepID=A0AAX0W366_9PSED|nr:MULTISPECIES: 4-(cytidine 5'-diphospho)-2-C-methyl-D-erythritol kinase [Pseudomonas]MBH3359222.1 4-(cytidine 5'-diphospho)-2-C-methyl-D-erythritol kinase [Pseudomonas guariconensis]MCO7620486.1 4-(cytidine 5'-diphospho)-2-C-methyl-D-erythritol kinase [Pseudomonas guariconensis]MEB3839833.1 4-(cytidine 5'-diphospho)-2-C-methyl-D-erythritol kinase [Pseudomonas guariconensis]MEB3872701.1 4-(cytidine 5'-diphospho)-2-C-methyl-D-erythritol kinase [Pseudomonas guariconensis]MEB3878284.1 4-(cytidin
MATLTLPAPAKLNLWLHIIGRRPDGYHELETVFQFLDHADQLHYSLRDDGQIHLRTEIAGVPHDSNLIVKAARQLQQQSGCALGVDIWLDKILPMGGGIGGGSSNAATTLLALNHLWQLGWDEDRLAGLGLGLGADVPVFVRGHAAFAQGVGEQLTPVDPEEPWYVVLVPQVSVSTAEIFSHPELTRDSLPLKMRPVPEGNSRNDCQPVVEQGYPEVRNALNLLGKYTEARLTGTGSCVFGAFPSKAEADKVLALLSETQTGFVAKGSNISMLHRKLQSLL